MVERTLPVVQTAGLCKTFRDFWRRPRVEAVKDLNLEIHPGEVFGLLGPNGSGKTTTIKMLLGLLYPTRGRISVFGKAPTDVAVKARIGFLPEESYLYRFLVAHETLDYYGRLFRLPARIRRDRTERLLDMVGLRQEARRRIGEYSKGMARRIGLAQALINDPEFLILDEPTAGLDPKQINETRELIRSLAGDHTIILSTHILPEVEQTCQQVIIINKGRLVATDSVQNLRNRARGGGSVVMEIAGRGAALDSAAVQHRLERVSGVTRVHLRESRRNAFVFEVENRKQGFLRGDLARAVTESGWDLNELRPAALSLEEIFLELTAEEGAPASKAATAEGKHS